MSSSKVQLVFGSDPEFFAAYENKNGKLFCLPPVYFRKYLGVEAIPNDRHPIFINDKKSGTIIHEDGAAFEMSLTPSTNWEDLFERIAEGKKLLERNILRHFSAVCDAKVHTLPTIGYDVKRWKDEDEEFTYCTQFGCDPDFDAFDTKSRAHVIDASVHPERYGGGHIHISGVKKIEESPLNAIYSLALTAGLAAVAFSDVPELEKQRTYLYGKPGKFRVQQYAKGFHRLPYTTIGIEYRTPSNRWTAKKSIASKVFEWIDVGIKYLFEKDLISKILPEFREPTIDAILNCKQKEAKEILLQVEAMI